MPTTCSRSDSPVLTLEKERATSPQTVLADADIRNFAPVARIMKTALPENAKIAKEAKECMQECVSEFISFITSEGMFIFTFLIFFVLVPIGGVGVIYNIYDISREEMFHWWQGILFYTRLRFPAHASISQLRNE